jgi:hypothetical protein
MVTLNKYLNIQILKIKMLGPNGYNTVNFSFNLLYLRQSRVMYGFIDRATITHIINFDFNFCMFRR